MGGLALRGGMATGWSRWKGDAHPLRALSGALRDGHQVLDLSAGRYAMGILPLSTRSTASWSAVFLPTCGVAQSAVGGAVDVTKRAGALLMEQHDGVSGEYALVRAGELEAVADVLGGVVDARLVDGEALVNTRVQGAVTLSVATVTSTIELCTQSGW
jgi:hypothetical protein